MQLVGRLDSADAPKSTLDGVKMYGMSFSSQSTGMCEMTSIGEMSPAMMHSPLSPLRMPLTTSLTPRLMPLTLVAFLTTLYTRLVCFLLASGLAITDTCLMRSSYDAPLFLLSSTSLMAACSRRISTLGSKSSVRRPLPTASAAVHQPINIQGTMMQPSCNLLLSTHTKYAVL